MRYIFIIKLNCQKELVILMKKWSTLSIGLFFFGVSSIGSCTIISMNEMGVAEKNPIFAKCVHYVTFASLLVLFVLTIIIPLVKGIIAVRRSLKDTEDTLFAPIDKGRKLVNKNNGYYLMVIRLVNSIYRENGLVHELVQVKDIELLQRRKEYLGKQLHFPDDAAIFFSGLSMSILAAFIISLAESSCNSFEFIIGIIVLAALAVVLVVFQYGPYAFKLNGLEREILEFELKCLNKAIDELNTQLSVNENQDIVLKTQLLVIRKLDKILKNAKKNEKQKILQDIERVQNLNLLDFDITKAHMEFFCIDNEQGCLVYKKEEGKINNYTGANYLINKDYSVLYRILQNYLQLWCTEDINNESKQVSEIQ